MSMRDARKRKMSKKKRPSVILNFIGKKLAPHIERNFTKKYLEVRDNDDHIPWGFAISSSNPTPPRQKEVEDTAKRLHTYLDELVALGRERYELEVATKKEAANQLGKKKAKLVGLDLYFNEEEEIIIIDSEE